MSQKEWLKCSEDGPATNEHLLVSCWFGLAATKVHPAPPQQLIRSLFFSNNASLEKQIVEKGWTFIYVPQMTLTADARVCALQSKWVKFYQFLDQHTEYANMRITYIDHKVKLDISHLLWLFTRSKLGSAVLLRHSPTRKTICEEIRLAGGQQRYAHSMPETKQWLKTLEQTDWFSYDVQVDNTGILHVSNTTAIRPLFSEVYNQCILLGQPECQIIWAALAQQHKHIIQRVAWFDLDVPWIDPNR
jgi:hypothetical protein